ncbi:MAG: zinc ribbon domain-containing protein [Gemmatimonadota bacterium]|nr:MAG: zinc ribbon domain-containing protein [Gemmatimonadota bacterium]
MSDEVFREVDGLLKEREKYEGWLSRLEAEKSAATERAYQRVRSDYQKRLQDVLAKLRVHSDAVHGKLREMEGMLAGLEDQRERRAEELDEARLRRSVGEYRDDGQWREMESQLVDSLKKADDELSGAQDEIQRLENILDVVQQAERPQTPPKPRAPAPTAPPAPPGPPPGGGRPQPAAPVAEGPPRAAAQPKPTTPAPEPPAVKHGPAPAAAPPAPPKPAVEEAGVSLGELVLEDGDMEGFAVETGGEGPAPSAAEAASSAAGGAAGGESVGDELAFLESLSLSGGEDTESFSFLEQHGSGTPQTIICPHCSAANDPAEWYCTECGEELPAE